MTTACIRKSQIQVSTLLLRDERAKIDVAGTGIFEAWHRSDMAEVLRDIRTNKTCAVLISVDYCTSHSEVRQLVSEIPEVPTIALIRQGEHQTVRTLLQLGYAGVKRAIDLQSDQAWDDLRDVITDSCGDHIERLLLDYVQERVGGRCRLWLDFMQAVSRTSRYSGSVRNLAHELGVLPSTLMSRFFRARLPAPKQYLTHVRLLRASALLKNPGLSLANVANHLDYSSPQSFGRHIRVTTGLSALQFRQRYTEGDLLSQLGKNLLEPYVQVLRSFRPVARPLETQSTMLSG